MRELKNYNIATRPFYPLLQWTVLSERKIIKLPNCKNISTDQVNYLVLQILLQKKLNMYVSRLNLFLLNIRNNLQLITLILICINIFINIFIFQKIF